jgi:hypothetical protein
MQMVLHISKFIVVRPEIVSRHDILAVPNWLFLEDPRVHEITLKYKVLSHCYNILFYSSKFMTVLFFSVETDSEDCDEYVAWLQIHKQPQSRVFELWGKTVRRRLTFIHDGTPSLDEIWQQWPRYTDKEGYALVSSCISCKLNLTRARRAVQCTDYRPLVTVVFDRLIRFQMA